MDFDTSTRGGRLGLALSRFGTSEKLAAEIGVHPNTVKRYKAESVAWSLDIVEAMAASLGVSADWLASGREAAPPDSCAVPYFDAVASAGYGRCDREHAASGVIEFPRRLLTEDFRVAPAALLVITADGDSMLPTVRSGDKLLIDTTPSDRITPGVYALVIRGDLFVKRVSPAPGGGVLVQSDNPAYPPETFPPGDVVRGLPHDAASLAIVGRVVWVISPL